MKSPTQKPLTQIDPQAEIFMGLGRSSLSHTPNRFLHTWLQLMGLSLSK